MHGNDLIALWVNYLDF